MCCLGFQPFVLFLRSLALKVFENRVGVGAIHVNLGHQREGDTVVEAAELGDLLIAARLLVRELVARETDDDKSLVFVLLVKCLQTIVLWRETALGSGVHNHQDLAFILGKINF